MKGQTLLSHLIMMGWRLDNDRGFSRTFSMHLFGLQTTRTFAQDELSKTGSGAEQMAKYYTEHALYELAKMLYEALYNKYGNPSQE